MSDEDQKSPRKFHKIIYKCEVLVDDAAVADGMSKGFYSMNDVAYSIELGGSSGSFGVESVEEVDGPTMAKLLMEQGSDPEFFQLDEEGNDIED